MLALSKAPIVALFVFAMEAVALAGQISSSPDPDQTLLLALRSTPAGIKVRHAVLKPIPYRPKDTPSPTLPLAFDGLEQQHAPQQLL